MNIVEAIARITCARGKPARSTSCDASAPSSSRPAWCSSPPALGAALYLGLKVDARAAAIVALAALIAMVIYNTTANRLRDRGQLGDQIADLSRGTSDLSRQMAEMTRRLNEMDEHMRKSVNRAPRRGRSARHRDRRTRRAGQAARRNRRRPRDDPAGAGRDAGAARADAASAPVPEGTLTWANATRSAVQAW